MPILRSFQKLTQPFLILNISSHAATKNYKTTHISIFLSTFLGLFYHPFLKFQFQIFPFYDWERSEIFVRFCQILSLEELYSATKLPANFLSPKLHSKK